MADVLAGSSLVVAIIAAFLTLWQGDISSALTLAVPRDPANRKGAKAQVSAVISWKLLPLTLIAALAAAILAPRAVILITDTISCIRHGASSCPYDDVGGLFLMTELLLIGLLAIIVSQLSAAYRKQAALDGP